MKKTTQCERLLQYMREFGSVTAKNGFDDLGIVNIHARLSELKKAGYIFNKKLMHGINRYGDKVHYYSYTLKENDEDKQNERKD